MSKQIILAEFQGVKKTYQVGEQNIYALRGIDYTINSGEFLGLVGPSGSGKSTFLNLLSMIDTPSEGVVLFHGENMAEWPDDKTTRFRNEEIGIIFQNYNLIPVFNARENVAFALRTQGVNFKESKERAEVALKEVGLENQLNQRPGQLSGGQKQRVAIARALVTNPSIVIADEPTAALDGKTGIEIIELMKKLNSTMQTTFIFSTHDPRVIDRVDNIIELEDGLIKMN